MEVAVEPVCKLTMNGAWYVTVDVVADALDMSRGSAVETAAERAVVVDVPVDMDVEPV